MKLPVTNVIRKILPKKQDADKFRSIFTIPHLSELIIFDFGINVFPVCVLKPNYFILI
jgi:hypothetical protein